ncbi:MAG TPA: nickel pincer cofactor biosynthesis protein LarB [candidate division Zixibacteria bacterium]|nr:nickel pincer cofactor biosynthesis protein LarB [candidate division Zixibacteria bacterium]
MDQEHLENLLKNFKEGKTSLSEVLEKLKDLPYEDLGYAKVDHHRALRKGFPEVVYCPGKTLEQIKGIYSSLRERNENILLTRASEEVYQELKNLDKNIQYNSQARIVYLDKKQRERIGSLLVICGGTSDIPVAEEAALTAEIMGSNVTRIYDAGVAGIHRLLNFRDKIFNANAIVAIAGMEGALPSVVAGLASCPVIAVPTSIGYGANLGGIAALLTMLNSCAPNVAVVNINNGFGGGLMGSIINRKREPVNEER